MTGALGGRAGALFARLLRDQGVGLRSGAQVAGIDASGQRRPVSLGDGT